MKACSISRQPSFRRIGKLGLSSGMRDKKRGKERKREKEREREKRRGKERKREKKRGKEREREKKRGKGDQRERYPKERGALNFCREKDPYNSRFSLMTFVDGLFHENRQQCDLPFV